MVTSWINFNANLNLSWKIELNIKRVITFSNLFHILSNTKIATVPTLLENIIVWWGILFIASLKKVLSHVGAALRINIDTHLL